MEEKCNFILIFGMILLPDIGRATPVGGNSACETTGTVFEGDPAKVTCNFVRPHDKFMVYRPPSSSEDNAEIVTVCSYTESGLDCNTPDGHNVTASRTNRQATIHIVSAQQKNAGKYFCKTLPAQKDNASNCVLTVQSNTPRTGHLITCKANGPVSLGQKSWLDCEFSKNASSTGITLVKTSGVGLTDEEDILACDRDGSCKVKKAGYEIEEKTETHVRVSIPELRTDHSGSYTCTSATIKGITDSCHLAAGHTEDGDRVSPLTYAVFGVLVAVLVVFFLFVLYKRKCFARRTIHTECKHEKVRTEEGSTPDRV